MQTVLSNYLNTKALIGSIAKRAMIGRGFSCLSPSKLTMYTDFTSSLGQANYAEGIDVSHHQGKIDWSHLTPSSSSKTFVIAKATEGVTYQDPMFVENIKHASAAGFQPGAYHFLRFGSSLPSDQMNNFLSQIKAAKSVSPDPKEWIIALDIEEHKEADYTLVRSVTEESVRYLREKAGITPYIYTRTSFWDLYVTDTPDIVSACPLWIARWRTNPPLPSELPRGWNEWAIWQYSDKGAVPGITGSVDLNRMEMV